MSKPRIGLLTSVIDNRVARGTALVARRLLEGLLPFRDRYDFHLVHHEPCTDPLYTQYPETLIPHLPPGLDRHVTRETAFWAGQRLQRKPAFDLFHYLHPRIWPSYLLTHAHHIVVSAFEGAHLLPENQTSHDNPLFHFTSRHLNRRMHHLTACSDSGRNEVIETYGVRPDQVTRIYLGVDDIYTSSKPTPGATEHLERHYNVRAPYLLAVSRFDPHKNILRLLGAYERVRETHPTVQLVLVGGPHTPDYSARVIQRIEALNEKRRSVNVIPYVNDADMPCLYREASGLVYPSLHEGFGLPVLEAMACNTPVITSPVSSLPEVAGDAALYADPYSEEALAEAMRRLLTDHTLSDTLRTAGHEQIKKFSWNQMVQETVALYERILKH